MPASAQYRLPLEDPHFMEASHFNPRYSPIVVHWRMLTENAAAHLRGDLPSLTIGGAPARVSGDDGADARLGISAQDQQSLLRALDFWWCYARYAGLPAMPLLAAALALALGALWAMARALAASRMEDRAA